ncbi:hypothetical protein BpHYR1_001732 [Brachionus plicatilis]|uniref:Uncharacterized protein n=1 Tax=Brachionus plicatilis TaxID=10195 RepID=A0A3M7QNP6_BRAPC|nr:hypothetical protein BpHYR1_001732 [Brachionus plicatilis]
MLHTFGVNYQPIKANNFDFRPTLCKRKYRGSTDIKKNLLINKQKLKKKKVLYSQLVLISKDAKINCMKIGFFFGPFVFTGFFENYCKFTLKFSLDLMGVNNFTLATIKFYFFDKNLRPKPIALDAISNLLKLFWAILKLSSTILGSKSIIYLTQLKCPISVNSNGGLSLANFKILYSNLKHKSSLSGSFGCRPGLKECSSCQVD